MPGILSKYQAPTPRLDATSGNSAVSPGEAPLPATNYAGIQSPLTSRTTVGHVYADPHNAAIVNRHERRDGIDNHWVYGSEVSACPQLPERVISSRFQQTIVRLFPWSINRAWYIAYPAASVMNGGLRNQGLSERTPQITTRISGGPGYFLMGPRPVYRSVQQVPRYSASPSTYKTKGAPG